MQVNFSNVEIVTTLRGTSRQKHSFLRRIAVPSALVALMLVAPTIGAMAGSGDMDRSGKHYLIDQKRLNELRAKIAELKDQAKHHSHRGGSGSGGGSSQDLQAQVTDLQNQVSALSSSNTSLVTQLQSAVNEIALLQDRVKVLEQNSGGSNPALTSLAKYLSVDTNPINGVKGPHIIFHDANVHIRSGSNLTDDGGSLRGLGNLFIGYNETPDPSIVYDVAGCDRAVTGSHNLVMGKGNLATSYGGVVLGSNSCATGVQATILGGEVNEAHGDWSVILGGNRNGTFFTTTPKFETIPQIR